MSSYGICLIVRLCEHSEVSSKYAVTSVIPIASLTLQIGHSDRVGGVAWHPQATLSQSEDVVNMASGAADMTVNLWSLTRYVRL